MRNETLKRPRSTQIYRRSQEVPGAKGSRVHCGRMHTVTLILACLFVYYELSPTISAASAAEPRNTARANDQTTRPPTAKQDGRRTSEIDEISSQKVSLPTGFAAILDPKESTIDVVGVDGNPRNLARHSETLHVNKQEHLVTVFARAAVGPSGRPTATLVEPTGPGNNFIALFDVATTPSTERTASVWIKAGPDHNGTSRMTLYAFGSRFHKVRSVPTDSWTRVSVTIPASDDAASIQLYCYPDEDTNSEAVFFDQVQVDDGPLTDYEPTGRVVGAAEISRIVDTVGGINLIPYENAKKSAPRLEKVDGLPAFVNPKGSATWISMQDVPAINVVANDIARTDGYTIAYVWRASGPGSQFGSFGRAQSRTGPWQNVLRTNTTTSSGSQDFSSDIPDAFTAAEGVGSGWHASVIVAQSEAQVEQYIDGGPKAATSQRIGVLGNDNWTGPGPHKWKLFGGEDQTEKAMLYWVLWPRSLTPEEVAVVFSAFKDRFDEAMPW